MKVEDSTKNKDSFCGKINVYCPPSPLETMLKHINTDLILIKRELKVLKVYVISLWLVSASFFVEKLIDLFK